MSLSKRFAAALVAAFDRMKVNPGAGSRSLFDAVNEAFTYVASKEHV